MIKTAHIATILQPADMLTKALSSSQLHDFCSKLGVRNLFQPPTLRGDVTDNSATDIKAKSKQERELAITDHSDTKEASVVS